MNQASYCGVGPGREPDATDVDIASVVVDIADI